MARKYVQTGTKSPKALACGILEDNGRVLFLTKIMNGIEQIVLPCALTLSGRSPLAEIKTEFLRQTGIDAEIHEIVLEGRINAGSRKRKVWIPALGFKVTAKNRTAKVAPEFSGFRWLALDDLKIQKLGKSAQWLVKDRKTGQQIYKS